MLKGFPATVIGLKSVNTLLRRPPKFAVSKSSITTKDQKVQINIL